MEKWVQGKPLTRIPSGRPVTGLLFAGESPPPFMEAVYLSIYCSHSDKALVLALVPLLVRSKT